MTSLAPAAAGGPVRRVIDRCVGIREIREKNIQRGIARCYAGSAWGRVDATRLREKILPENHNKNHNKNKEQEAAAPRARIGTAQLFLGLRLPFFIRFLFLRGRGRVVHCVEFCFANLTKHVDDFKADGCQLVRCCRHRDRSRWEWSLDTVMVELR